MGCAPLRQQQIADTLVLEDAGRLTAQRTHLRGQDGPVLWLDRQRRVPALRALASRLFECVDAVLPKADGVLCAEDKLGLKDADLKRLWSAARSVGCPVYVGSGDMWSRFWGPSATSTNDSVGLVEIPQELRQPASRQAFGRLPLAVGPYCVGGSK